MLTDNMHIIANLAFILLAILAFLLAVKKFKTVKSSSNKYIKLINMVPIGSKEKIMLMEVNNVVLLVGATPSHIETLYVFDELTPNKIMESPVVESKKGFLHYVRHATKNAG